MANRSDHPAGPTLVPGSRRGRPGRPKQGDHGIFQRPDVGDNAGTAVLRRRAGRGDAERAVVHQTVAPVLARLLDVKGAAAYLAVSPDTIRSLTTQGILLRVRIPCAGDRELSKWLFDRADLDHLIEAWKESRTHG